MILILFTNSYPSEFSSEKTFLRREVSFLAQNFDKVILVPKRSSGTQSKHFSGVEVDESFSVYYKRGASFISLLKNVLKSRFFYKEIKAKPSLLLMPVKLARLVVFLGRATLTYKWVTGWIDTLGQNNYRVMLYSYWFDDTTMGLSLVKQENPHIQLVSRAHGYDIYEEQYFPYYWPLRREILASLDKLFLASNDGREYFRNRYPEFYELFETAHLGVNTPGFISRSSSDGILRIVSCAHIVPLKRVGLLLEGIALAAHMRSEQKFEWHHFGDGKDRRNLEKALTNQFPPNAIGYFPGHIPNSDIMKHYREKPVDIFVNLSTTEGGAPVSIQEAASCGIPIIATGVGGNPEIVSERNGILLSPNPTPEEVAQALLKISDNPNRARQMREESRQVWAESYNADVNFRAFSRRLKEIGQG